jgi:hypothetical protein
MVEAAGDWAVTRSASATTGTSDAIHNHPARRPTVDRCERSAHEEQPRRPALIEDFETMQGTRSASRRRVNSSSGWVLLSSRKLDSAA